MKLSEAGPMPMPTMASDTVKIGPAPGREHARPTTSPSMPSADQAGPDHPAAPESPAHHGLGGEGHADGPGQEQGRQRLARLLWRRRPRTPWMNSGT